METDEEKSETKSDLQMEVKGEMKPPKPPGMHTSTPKMIRRRHSVTSAEQNSYHSTLSPYKYLTQSTRQGGPVTGSCPSTFIEKTVNNILASKNPKQSSEITAKSLLFLKTRNSIFVTSPFEITPSVEYERCDIFHELRWRSGVQKLARDLVEFVAKDRKQGYRYDEIFNQLRSEIIYTSNNYITAFYNNHSISSVDKYTLAIQCVQLACKTQSTFKRLEKLVMAARQCFRTQIKLDRHHYADVEMMVLQSIGFQMHLSDDYPQKYIYQFKPIMIEKFKCFKANEKKMNTLCHCAIHIATLLVESSPIMLNRESSVVAAACILVANNFKPVMEISDWYKFIIGCENLDVRTLKETADLVFDTLKYNQVNWLNLPTEPLVINQIHVKSQSTSSSPVHTSPPQQMLSPISGISETCSSGFGSESRIVSSLQPEAVRRNSSFNSPFSKPDVPRARIRPEVQSPLVKSNFSLIKMGSKLQNSKNSDIPPPPPPPMNSQLTLSPQTVKVLKDSETPTSNILLQKSKSESHKSEIIAKSETTNSLVKHSIQSQKSVPTKLGQITSQISTESKAFTPLSSCASDDAVFDLNMSVDSMNSSCASSSYSSISVNSSLSSATAFSLHLSNILKHPDETKYISRLEAIKQNEQITRFYACSKERYNTLSRDEKDIVKSYKNEVKKQRDQKLRKQRDLKKSQKRRKSAFPVLQHGNTTAFTETKTTTSQIGNLEPIQEAKRQKF